MSYSVEYAPAFNKGLEKAQRRYSDLTRLWLAVDLLRQRKPLPNGYKNQKLKGKDVYDCHIFPDLVLLYRYQGNQLILELLDLGTHKEVGIEAL